MYGGEGLLGVGEGRMAEDELQIASRIIVKTKSKWNLSTLYAVLLHLLINVPKVSKSEFPYSPLGESLYSTTENVNILKLISQSY